jgi:uncharacterized protein (DUF1810 family)
LPISLCYSAGTQAEPLDWYTFPQNAGVGLRAMSREFRFTPVEEARAYLVHPILGPQLRECTGLVIA